MIVFITTIQKFKKQGEKTSWTYIEIPASLAEQLYPGNKKSFRVKGKFDNYQFDGISTLPMGNGNFIIPLNTEIRKEIKKSVGHTLKVQISYQPKAYEINNELMECLKDEPAALKTFNSLTGSHRNYFSKWIESAKTQETRAKRIAIAVNALALKMGYPEMLRYQQEKKNI
jgi:Domain of unknown function (DUF1905)/Bacteriocin-protection, YdeI or OmpD-Associated